MTSPARIAMPIQVMYYDTDAGGVVHNLAYLRFIEAARTLLAIDLGMDFDVIERTGIHPVVVRSEVDYKKPAKLGEHLVIEGGVAEVGRARFWVEFEVVRRDSRDVLVTCRQALALVRIPEGRPVRIAEGFPSLNMPR
ncbi:MAG: tol-pal system-associated acyl-CoA thioesterase [Terrimicrobiaceae bacterium]